MSGYGTPEPVDVEVDREHGLTLVWPDGRAETAEGTCGGRIAPVPEGRAGFGFDPVFVADDLGRSLGRATPAEKHQISHRARAMRALGDRLRAA